MMELWGDTNPWFANDPNRRCYTCGAPPAYHFMDGSPGYRCTHPPVLGRSVTALALAITLGPRDIRLAQACAERRNAKPRTADAWGAKALDQAGRLAANVTGAGGELAFARLTGLPWRCDADRAYGKPDVGGYQVRTRRPSTDLALIVHERDQDTPVVLMVGDLPTYRLVGWLPRGLLGMRAEWWRNPGDRRPAWFVPQDALVSPGSIPELGVQSGGTMQPPSLAST